MMDVSQQVLLALAISQHLLHQIPPVDTDCMTRIICKTLGLVLPFYRQNIFSIVEPYSRQSSSFLNNLYDKSILTTAS